MYLRTILAITGYCFTTGLADANGQVDRAGDNNSLLIASLVLWYGAHEESVTVHLSDASVIDGRPEEL